MTKLICKALISAFMTISSFVYADQLDDSYVLGFGSCITEKRDQPIWSAIEKEDIMNSFLWEIMSTVTPKMGFYKR